MRLLLIVFFVSYYTMALCQLPIDQPILLRDQVLLYHANFRADQDLAVQIQHIPTVGENIYCWLQFYAPLKQREIDLLKILNFQLTGYVKEHTYLAAIPSTTKGNPLKGLPVRGIFPIEPSHRLSPALRDALRDTNRKNEKTAFQITYFQSEGALMLDAMLSKMPFSLPIWQHSGNQLQLTLPLRDLELLAASPAVR